MSQYSGFKVGNCVGPLTSSTSNSLLQDSDPALFYTLDYFKSMIQIYLGARFDAEMTRVGLTQFLGKASSTAMHFDPLPFLQSSGVQPPFLAIYPKTDVPEERTRHWYQLVETWEMLWVLPSMDAAQFSQLCSLLRFVGKIVVDRLENTLDPSWNSGTPFAQLGGVAEIKLERMEYGSIPKVDTNLLFPTLFATFSVKEVRDSTPGLEDLTGMDGSLTVGGLDLVDFKAS